MRYCRIWCLTCFGKQQTNSCFYVISSPCPTMVLFCLIMSLSSSPCRHQRWQLEGNSRTVLQSVKIQTTTEISKPTTQPQSKHCVRNFRENLQHRPKSGHVYLIEQHQRQLRNVVQVRGYLIFQALLWSKQISLIHGLSTEKQSPLDNFAHTVTKFCDMWEGLSLPHVTKFSNCRG